MFWPAEPAKPRFTAGFREVTEWSAVGTGTFGSFSPAFGSLEYTQMTSWRYGIFVWLAALPVCAGTIDVTGQTQVTLGLGDALAFTFSASSYLAHATPYQAPAYPTGINFLFATADLASAWDFTAKLQSGDGWMSLAFDNVAVSDGSFHGANYNGAAAVVSGSAELAPDFAAGIFSGPAILMLRNAASGVTVGVPPYQLAQTMVVSLVGGGVSVGGVIYGVSLEEAPRMRGAADLSLDAMDDFSADGSRDVPEANSGLLLTGGGALLIALGVAARCYSRWGRR
jgi:hypothetical protein